MNNYFELKISINPEIEEIVSDICFSNFACEGVVLAEEDWKDLEMTSTTRGILKVFLTELNCNPIEILKTEREILKSRGFSDNELGSWEIVLDKKENQDWSKKWKEKWTVTHVTDKIAVVPSWLEYQPKENEITITLDPGCAFGTGTHQTTQLCMRAIEKYLEKDDSMADIGTGSGILAICAKKFGSSTTYGCDNDETVIDVCIENAEINGINDIVFELKTADKLTTKYDFAIKCTNGASLTNTASSANIAINTTNVTGTPASNYNLPITADTLYPYITNMVINSTENVTVDGVTYFTYMLGAKIEITLTFSENVRTKGLTITLEGTSLIKNASGGYDKKTFTEFACSDITTLGQTTKCSYTIKANDDAYNIRVVAIQIIVHQVAIL